MEMALRTQVAMSMLEPASLPSFVQAGAAADGDATSLQLEGVVVGATLGMASVTSMKRS